MDGYPRRPHLRFALAAARLCGSLRMLGLAGEVREGLRCRVVQGDESRSLVLIEPRRIVHRSRMSEAAMRCAARKAGSCGSGRARCAFARWLTNSNAREQRIGFSTLPRASHESASPLPARYREPVSLETQRSGAGGARSPDAEDLCGARASGRT